MTPQQINERIAKMCGWKAQEHDGLWHLTNGKQILGFNSGLSDEHAWNVLCPDYCESLDDCRDFESKLTATEQTGYAVQLRYIVTRNVERDHEPLNPDTLRIPDGRYYCATSPERCEAFLRMKGQWDES